MGGVPRVTLVGEAATLAIGAHYSYIGATYNVDERKKSRMCACAKETVAPTATACRASSQGSQSTSPTKQLGLAKLRAS